MSQPEKPTPPPVGGFRSEWDRMRWQDRNNRLAPPPSRVEVSRALPLIDMRGVSGFGIFWRYLTLGLLSGVVLAIVTLAAIIG